MNNASLGAEQNDDQNDRPNCEQNDDQNDSPNCESLSPQPSCDSTTLEDLQNFIDESFQCLSVHKRKHTSPAPTIDSSIPLPTSVINPASIEERFNKLKEDFDAKLADLATKLTYQIEIADKCKQDVCKLTNENLNLKSRLAKLEEKVSGGNKSISSQGPAKSIEIINNSKKHYLPIQNVDSSEVNNSNITPISNFQPALVNENSDVHSSLLSETKVHDSSLDHNTHNVYNEAELVTVTVTTRQKQSKNGKDKCPINSRWENIEQIPVIITNRRRKKKPYPRNFSKSYSYQTYHPRFFRNPFPPWQTVG